jgi:hypothetical protein
LMERARYHLGRDELLEAQRAAEFAHKLVENSDLEFAPDEERPIDLLVTITDRRQSKTAESSESQLALKPAKAKPTAAQQPAEETKSGEAAPQDSQDATEFDPYAASPAQPGQPVQRRPVFETAIVMLDAPSFEDPADVNPTAYTASSNEGPMKRLLAPRRVLPPVVDEQDPIETPPELEQEALAAPPPPATHESKPSSSTTRSGPNLGIADDDLAFEDEEDEPPVEKVRAAGLWPRWLPLSLLSLLTTAFCIWYWRRRAALAA